MTSDHIKEEILRYIDDKTYNYAILVDGEWGCGKTFFVMNQLLPAIKGHEKAVHKNRKVLYITLNGLSCPTDIKNAILSEALKDVYAESDVGREIGEERTTKNVFTTVVKIGAAVLKDKLPIEAVSKSAFNWLNLENYIIIFDDLERCNAIINEIMGLINGLVEHDGLKVILVANEKELERKILIEGTKELQYLLAIKSEIDWPKYEEHSIFGGGRKNNTISFGELEHRRKSLFPEENTVTEYEKIREKVVGITVSYQPDLSVILKTLVENLNVAEDIKKILYRNMKSIIQMMDRYGHHNLRTFQFFLSKVQFLLPQINYQELKDKKYDRVNDYVVLQCAKVCLIFKSNFEQEENELWNSFSSVSNQFSNVSDDSKAIKFYVEGDELDRAVFSEEIKKFIEQTELRPDPDDPYNLLMNGYYCHEQIWVEQQMDAMLEKLEENYYPISLYYKILELLACILSLGFNSSFFEKAKELMYMNMSEDLDSVKYIENDYWYIENKELKTKLLNAVGEINKRIGLEAGTKQRESINTILMNHNDSWVERLDYITGAEKDRYQRDLSVFKEAEVETWFEAITETSVGCLYDFRRWLSSIYPRDIKRKSFIEDKDSLYSLFKLLKEYTTEDIVKQFNIKWLLDQIIEIFKVNDEYEGLRWE